MRQPSTLAVRRDSGLAAWRQIADAIVADIADTGLRPGDRLSTEGEYAARFHVNRHTVRRAVAALAAHGLVRTAQGSGTFVAESAALPEALPGARLREPLPKPGREARGALVTAEHLRAYGLQADALRVAPGAAVLQIISLRDGRDGPLALATSWLPLPRFTGIEAAFARKGSLHRAYAKLGLRARRRSAILSTRAADMDEAHLLAVPPGTLLIVFSTVNVDGDGQPIQATETRYVASRIELEIDG